MESEEIYIDSYRLGARLGSGAFGDVYLAQHIILTDRLVAIKLMHATYLDSSEAILRFFAEAQILDKLKHPHILPIINVSAYGDLPYLVTEYASKGSLRDRLKRQYPHLLPVEESIAILAQIGQALQHAHQYNIIHRDLKPENILFNDKGDALLADFGIATILTTASIKQTSTTGTMAYMAPEQFHEMVSKESDQYALGCIAYELFTGHMPFIASNVASLITKCLMEQPIAPRQYNPGLPLHIERAVLKALAKQRTERHADISAFIEALRTSTNSQIRIHAVSQPTTSDPAPKTKERWMNKGNACFKVKHYVDALAAYEEVIQFDPGDAYTYNCKGLTLEQMQREQEALLAYEKAVWLDSNYIQAWYNKGNVLCKLNRHSEALAAYEHILRLDPNQSIAWYHKGRMLKQLSMLEEAEVAFKKARLLGYLENDKAVFDSTGFDADEESYNFFDPDYNEEVPGYPYSSNDEELNYPDDDVTDKMSIASKHINSIFTNSADFYNEKGILLVQQQHFQEALAAFEQALRLNPNYASVWCHKGDVLWELFRLDEALEAYNQALQLNQYYAPAYIGKGRVLQILNYHEEALVALEQAIQLDPSNAYAWSKKGDALLGLNFNGEALAAFEYAIQLNCNLIDAYIGKGMALRKLKRLEESLRTYEDAHRLAPDEVAIYQYRGNVLFDLKRYEEALVNFESFIQVFPNFAFGYTSKGDILYALKRYEEALIAYEHAIRLDPDDANTHYKKASLLLELGYNKEALAAAELLIQIVPNAVQAYVLKGTALCGLKQFNEALVVFEFAIHLNPNFAFVYASKSTALCGLNRYQEALVVSERAIQLDPDLSYAYLIKGLALQGLGRSYEADEAYEAYEKASQLGLQETKNLMFGTNNPPPHGTWA